MDNQETTYVPIDIRQAFEDFTESLTGLSQEQTEQMEWIGNKLNKAAEIKTSLRAYINNQLKEIKI